MRVEKVIDNIDENMITIHVIGPKILNALLCSVSRRSSDSLFTPVQFNETNKLPEVERELYNKWQSVYYGLLVDRCKDTLTDEQIKQIAAREAEDVISVFVETDMTHTMSKKEANAFLECASEFVRFQEENKTNLGINDNKKYFDIKLSVALGELIRQCEKFGLEPKKDEDTTLYSRGTVFEDLISIKENNNAYRFNGSFNQLTRRLANGQANLSFKFLGKKVIGLKGKFSSLDSTSDVLRCSRILSSTEYIDTANSFAQDLTSIADHYPQGLKVLMVEETDPARLVRQTLPPIERAVPSDLADNICMAQFRLHKSEIDKQVKEKLPDKTELAKKLEIVLRFNDADKKTN